MDTMLPEIYDETPYSIQTSYARRDIAFGEFFNAMFAKGLDYTVPGLISSELFAHYSNLSNVNLNKEEWKESEWFRKGIKWEEGMTDGKAQALADLYDDRRYRDSLMQRYQGAKALPGFGIMMSAQFLDPVNYIPIVGWGAKAATLLKLGKYAKLGRLGKAGEAGIRTAAEFRRLGPVKSAALVGATDAFVGTAITEPFIISSLRSQGEAVGWNDAVLDIAMAPFIGALFGGGMAALFDTRVGAMRRSPIETKQNVAKVMEAAVGDVSRGGDVNVGKLIQVTIKRNERALARVQNPFAAQIKAGRGRFGYEFAGELLEEVGDLSIGVGPPVGRRATPEMFGTRPVSPDDMITGAGVRGAAPEMGIKLAPSEDYVTRVPGDVSAEVKSRFGKEFAEELLEEIELAKATRQGAPETGRLDPGAVDVQMGWPGHAKAKVVAKGAKEEITAFSKTLQKKYKETDLGSALAKATPEERSKWQELTSETFERPAGLEIKEGVEGERLVGAETPVTIRAAEQTKMEAALSKEIAGAPKHEIDTTTTEPPDILPAELKDIDPAKGMTPKERAEEIGIDIESGTYPEKETFDMMKEEDLVSKKSLDEMKAAEELVEKVNVWDKALQIAASCIGRRG